MKMPEDKQRRYSVFDERPQQVGISCIPCHPPEEIDVFNHGGSLDAYEHLHGFPDMDEYIPQDDVDEDVFNFGGGLDAP